MKITIDTDHTPHRIEVKGSTSLGELIEFLSKYYPDFTWKDVRIGDGTMFEAIDWTKLWKDTGNFPVTHSPPYTGDIVYRSGTTTGGTDAINAGTKIHQDLETIAKMYENRYPKNK